jgi:hypothetical protein
MTAHRHDIKDIIRDEEFAPSTDAGPDYCVQLALCEQERLILRPNVPYMFTVHPGCARCNQLALYSSPDLRERKP